MLSFCEEQRCLHVTVLNVIFKLATVVCICSHLVHWFANSLSITQIFYQKDLHNFSGKDAEYTIQEDDKYYLGLVNTNPKSIIMNIAVNVTAKLYDVSKARNMCSTIKGSCRLMLPFPKAQYVVVTTPDNVRPYPFSHVSISPRTEHWSTKLTAGGSRWMVHWAVFCGSCNNLHCDFRYRIMQILCF